MDRRRSPSRSRAVDLLILDLVMPGMDGFTLERKEQGIPRTASHSSHCALRYRPQRPALYGFLAADQQERRLVTAGTVTLHADDERGANHSAPEHAL